MPRIAVTGHMDLAPETVHLVSDAIADRLHELLVPGESMVGLSCIARGADSIFGKAIIQVGGRLEVYLPAANYRDRKVKPDHIAEFDYLIENATLVHVMPFPEPNREAYEAANDALLAACDRLFAIWDGVRSQNRGGTADFVRLAEKRGVPIDRIWPTGSSRSSVRPPGRPPAAAPGSPPTG